MRSEMSVTQFYILIIAILSDHHHHFHSSLEAVASPEEGREIRKTWLKLPVKLVSFRHSKSYLWNTKSSQFTSYETGVNRGGNRDGSTRSLGPPDAPFHLQQSHHHHRSHHPLLLHAFLSPEVTPRPRPNFRNYLINGDGTDSHNPNFLQFSAPPGPLPPPLDTGQDGHHHGFVQQDLKNCTGSYGPHTSSPIRTASIVQNHNRSNSLPELGPSRQPNLTDREGSRESTLSPPNPPSTATKIIPENMPTASSSSRLPVPLPPTLSALTHSWINATHQGQGKNHPEEWNKALNFYEPSSIQEQLMSGKHTSANPLLGLGRVELDSGGRLSSTLPTSLHPSSFPLSKWIHIHRVAVNRYSSQPDPGRKTRPKKRSHPPGQGVGDEITEHKYVSTTNRALMNYSIGDSAGIGEELGGKISSNDDDVGSFLRLPTDMYNDSFILPQTIDPEMEDFFTPSPADNQSVGMRDRNEFAGTFTTTSLPLKEDERARLVRAFKASHPVKVWEAVGIYDDSYLDTVNSHWLQFQPADPLVHKMLGILYGILMVIGIGGNLLVIVMFVRCRSLRTPPNYLIVNLAVSDFFMMAKMPLFIFNSLYEGPVLGVLGCKIYGFVGGLSGTASIMSLATIALDRYYVIVYPMNPLKRTTSTRAFLMITVVWSYSALFSSIPLFGLNGYVSEGYLTSCSFDYLSDKTSDRIFVFIFFVAAFVSPLSVIIFSYSRIFQMVRAAERVEFFCSGNGTGRGLMRESFKYKDQKKHKTEFKIAMLSSVIILIWILAWTPYAIIALLGIFGYKELLTPFISSVPALFCKTASCIDPFLYAINHPRFQRELKNKLKICCTSRRSRGLGEASYYSNTCKDNNSDNSLTGLRRKASPPTAHGSPCDSVRSHRYHCNTGSIIINLKDSPRFTNPSRSSPVQDKTVTYNLPGNRGLSDETNTNIGRSSSKKVEIRLVGNKGHTSSSPSNKKRKDQQGTGVCDYKYEIEDRGSYRAASADSAAPEDPRDLRMKDILLSNKKFKKLSRSDSATTTTTTTCTSGGDDVIVNYRSFNGKSLSADSTSRCTFKLETTIM